MHINKHMSYTVLLLTVPMFKHLYRHLVATTSFKDLLTVAHANSIFQTAERKAGLHWEEKETIKKETGATCCGRRRKKQSNMHVVGGERNKATCVGGGGERNKATWCASGKRNKATCMWWEETQTKQLLVGGGKRNKA